MIYEYKTTTAAIADFYDSRGDRKSEVNVAKPDDSWELVCTTANAQIVIYSWRRPKG